MTKFPSRGRPRDTSAHGRQGRAPYFSAGAALELCQQVRTAMDAGTVEAGEVLEDGIVRQDEVRRVWSIEPAPPIVAAVEACFEDLRAAVAAFFGLALGDREGAGFLRYEPGGFYRPHRDRGETPAWPDAGRRAVALVLFLNSSRVGAADGEFDGGALRLLEPELCEIPPRAGLVVAFPAGCLHEVAVVQGGRRDTVVDWFYDGDLVSTTASSTTR